MSDALGYMLVNHEEQFGEHRVILMKEQDIQAEVQRRSQEENGYDVTAKLIERVTGKRLVITR